MTTARTCERARTWFSLRLDGELSEFESVLLDAHLGRCAPCAAAAAQIKAVTGVLRAVAPEPSPVGMKTPPARSERGSLRAFYAAVAATLTLATGAMGLGSLGAIYVVSEHTAAPELSRVSAVANAMPDDMMLLGGARARSVRPVPQRLLWPG
jgi:anti-sigma factor RsiW